MTEKTLLKDKKFIDFCNDRVIHEIKEYLFHSKSDNYFMVLNKGFKTDKRYVVPLFAYVSSKLHYAKLLKNRKSREREFWWLYTLYITEKTYSNEYERFFEPLVNEIENEIFEILKEEYIKSQNKRL